MKTPRWWTTHGLISQVLTPLSWLYAAGASIDRACKTPQRAALPTLAIGNLTAGGAGKTPTAIALAKLLQAAGHAPHIISRGYKGSTRDVTRVTPESDWRVVGDEPLLLAKAAPTWVCPHRLAAAAAAKQAGATLAIADDALQHHALKADVTLLVLDGAYGIGNGRLLPAGPLRESLSSALARCQAVIMIGEDTHQLGAQITLPLFRATLEPTCNTSFLREGRWLAFAGIARPQKFYDTLRSLGADIVATQDFADHHPYTPEDYTQLASHAEALGAKLITTEKDAVKFPVNTRENLHILPVTLQINEAGLLVKLLTDLIFPPTQ